MRTQLLKKYSALMSILFITVTGASAMAGGITTSAIDIFPDNGIEEDFPYERIVFACELDVPEANFHETNPIARQLNIIRVHHGDFRLQEIKSNGEKGIFSGYGSDFEWSYMAPSYHQSIDNDWDVPWLDIDLDQIKGRHYRGVITTPKDYYNDSETEIQYPVVCRFVDDLQDNAGTTPLMQAAIYGDTARIKTIIEEGVEVNVTDDNGYTALMYAVINGYSQSASLLMNAGADVNATNSFGNDALNYALSQGNQYLSWLLIESGAHGEAVSINGDTSLSLGLESGLFSLLVKKGLIASAGLPSVVKELSVDQLQTILQTGVDVNAVDSWGNSALHVIARTEDVEKARLLMDFGANIELENHWGSTALAIAGYSRDNKVAIELLGNGASVVNPGKDSPLHNALYSGNFALAEIMLEKGGIDYTTVDSRGYDLLISATSYSARSQNQEAMVKKLMDRGADAGFVAADGNTALIQVALDNQLNVVKMLVAGGANLNSINGYGFTAVGYARYNHYDDIVAVLLEAGADPTLGRQPLSPR